MKPIRDVVTTISIALLIGTNFAAAALINPTLRKPDAHVEDIRGILGQMLLSGEEGDKQTKALSGGEQARLAFSKLILTKPNILIFDEPTNHLDLEAINALNIALQRYEGTVLLVTHDHDLIDEVATRLWVFREDGIEDFQGPYTEWKGKHN
jgi:ATPase subunit of ABC transporter with duplicated ATPase domains